jgi:DNA modification methylase
MSRAMLHCGDVRAVLAGLPAESVQCVVTSPPYWGLRDYGVSGQLGLEGTPQEYVRAMVEVFAAVHRVLRKDGVLWLNLGDSYAGSGKGTGDTKTENRRNGSSRGVRIGSLHGESGHTSGVTPPKGWKAKDLVGIPWRVAFALQEDGWWLRSDVIWAKPNPMPESVTDRPTRSHEYLFLLTKSERYYYDAAAIAEDATCGRLRGPGPMVQPGSGRNDGAETGDYRVRRSVKRGAFDGKTNTLAGREAFRAITDTRNARSVWTITTQSYPAAHFATFPEELARRCILAGSSPKACEHCGAPWERVTEREAIHDDRPRPAERIRPPHGWGGLNETGSHTQMGTRTETTGWRSTCSCENTGSGRCIVLDPFGGSGTVAQVATGNGRDSVYIDLNPAYLDLARQRIGPMLCEDAA